jgi:hypothetical protein
MRPTERERESTDGGEATSVRLLQSLSEDAPLLIDGADVFLPQKFVTEEEDTNVEMIVENVPGRPNPLVISFDWEMDELDVLSQVNGLDLSGICD